jgi:hypothetical protein
VVYIKTQKVIDSLTSALEKEANDVFDAVNSEGQKYYID